MPSSSSRGLRNSRPDRGTQAPDDLPDIEFPAWLPLVDIDHAMTSLLELIELLPQAPLFPVDSLARYFDMLTPALVDHPLYPPVRSGLDEATSRQAGEASTAVRCRTRAMALYRSGKRLAALRELHEAKVNWWHGDTARDSILAMLHIAGIYSDLLLLQAAKKYALLAGFAALQADDTRVRDLAPAALFQAADCDYQSGAWLSALRLTRVAILLQGNYTADPWNLDKHRGPRGNDRPGSGHQGCQPPPPRARRAGRPPHRRHGPDRGSR